MSDAVTELRENNKLLQKMLQEEKSARGALEAKMETLLQLVAAKSEPERIQMLEKQALKAQREEMRREAVAVALAALPKGAKKESVTHVRYVTGSYYQRKGVLYPPGTVLKIPVKEEPAIDWKVWKQPRITRPGAIDPDASVPFGELRASTSALSATKRDEARATQEAVARGDMVISHTMPDTTPDQGEVKDEEQQAPSTEQGPESALSSTRASDTDVG